MVNWNDFLLWLVIFTVANLIFTLSIWLPLYRKLRSPKLRNVAREHALRIVGRRWYLNALQIIDEQPHTGSVLVRLTSYDSPRQTEGMVIRLGHPDLELLKSLPRMTILQLSYEETRFVRVLGFECESYLRFVPVAT